VAPDKQQEQLQEYLVHEAARVMRMDPASLDLQQPLSNFGLDSIMTVELRDRIDAEWQVRVPLVEFFREPTIARLSTIMLEQLRSVTQSSPTDPAELLNRLDQMSETEMDKLPNGETPSGSTAILTQALLDDHRQHFPALDGKSYFNYGAHGTLPRPAID